jgi:chemotaxis protein methyltransferase CheR
VSVALHRVGGLNRLAVLGRIDTPDMVAELGTTLQAALADCGKEGVELSFFDADALPREAITLLARYLDEEAPLRVVAYHALLAHSLMRLGLPVRQIMRRTQPTVPDAVTPCRAIALAGSAGSLEKILHIVANLPPGGLPVFVLQHVDEEQVNLLDQLLKTRTEYEVLMPQHMTPVRDNTIYVAPPGYHMKVAHGTVYLTRDRKVQFSRPAIDVLYTSLAAEYGAAVMTVLLCGYGRDGVDGCAALITAGAVVLVEDPAECGNATAMPQAAITDKQYSHVLCLQALTSLCAATAAHSGNTANDATDDSASDNANNVNDDALSSGTLLELFLEAVAVQCGHDFRSYQRDSLKRRIQNLMQQFGLRRFADFQRAVLTDAALFERLAAELPVGVTSFFRHPEQLCEIRDEILPYLASFPMIKMWSAGCSTGEEAYSLAIMLEELQLLERCHLFATDLNSYQLNLARTGLYPAAPLDANRSNYRVSGGTRGWDDYLPPGERFLSVPERLRQHVLFHRHSLASDGIFNEFQLILCRNVLIYFDAELQRQVLRRFARSLHVDGFLVLGPQDGLNLIAQEQGFIPYRAGSHIYRRGRAADG